MNITRTVAILLSLPLLLCLSCRAMGQTNSQPTVRSPYSDPRIVQWSSDILKGNRTVVLNSVKADLLSGKAHPNSALIWSFLQYRKGNPGAIEVNDMAVSLGPLADVYYLYREGRYVEATTKYPPSTAAQINNTDTLVYLGWAAILARRYTEAVNYIAAGVKLNKNESRFAQQARDVLSGSIPGRLRLLQIFGHDPELTDSPVGRFIAKLTAHSSFTPFDLLEAIDGIIKESGADPFSLALRASAQADLERFADASESYSESINMFPFSGERLREAAVQQLRIGNGDKARELIGEIVHMLWGQSDSVDARFAETYARVLLDVGDKGRAREVLENALASAPHDPGLLEDFARLELNSSRPNEAIRYAREAMAAEPSDISYQTLFLKSLKGSGRLSEAEGVLASIEVSKAEKSLDYYETANELFRLEKKVEESIGICRRAISDFPEDEKPLMALAVSLSDSGDLDKSRVAFEKAFEVGLPSTTELNTYYKFFLNRSSKEDFSTEMSKLRQKSPSVEMFWTYASNDLGTFEVEKKVSVWNEAIRLNPKDLWPRERLMSVYLDSEEWNKAEEVRQDLNIVARDGSIGDKINALFQPISVGEFRMRSTGLSREEQMTLLRDLEKYRESGGYPGAYHRFRAEVLEAAGSHAEAGQEIMEALKFRPDDGDMVWELLTKYSGELGQGRTMKLASEYVARDPYDGERLNQVIHFNVMWGGSSINALRMIHDMSVRGMENKVRRSDEGTAWGNLGNAAKEFEMNYQHAGSISSSDRYISWYDNARQSAQQASSNVEIDWKSGVATITRPNGEIIIREDDYVSGLPKLIQIGKSFIKAEYDDNGRISRVFSSAGEEVRLTYNPSGRIESLQTARRTVKLKYGENGKMNSILTPDIGELKVYYDSAGKVERTESDKGSSAAIEIASSLSSLLDIVSVIGDGCTCATPQQISKVEELPYSDADRDRLVKAYESASEKADQEQVKTDRLKAAELGVPLVSYLLNHLQDSRKNEQLSREVLEQMFLTSETLQGERSQTLRIQSIDLWYDLVSKTRETGVDKTDWELWTKERAWLWRNGLSSPAVRERARDILAKESARPVVLLKSSQWLPHSYLNSDGFWRKYQDPRFRDATTLLVRKNHDVVVGGAGGILVLRNGYWESFQFEKEVMRFVSRESRDKDNLNVRCLEEDTRGGLWIGTTTGLFLVKGDYDDHLVYWQTKDDGLPSPYIKGIVTYGDGVLIATENDLLLADGKKILPLSTLGDESIAFARPVEHSEGSSGEKTPIALVGTSRSLYELRSGKLVKLENFEVEDAYWSSSTQQLFELRKGDFYVRNWTLTGGPEEAVHFPGTDIVKVNRIFGIAPLAVDDELTVIAIYTDSGLTFFREDHFENKSLPYAEGYVAVRALHSRDLRTYFLTSEGVYALERGQAAGDVSGPVLDILTVNDQGITYVARGDRLEFVSHSEIEKGARPFARIASTHLAIDRDGRLVTNDGMTVVRFDKATTQLRELFSATQTVDGDWNQGQLTSILVASDDTVWVTAGSSVFRWKEGMEKPEEFSIFINSDQFPARSEMISRIVETIDKRIWVVASNESHVNYRGIQLSGGLLEWTGSGFRRLPLYEQTPYWFITSYTPLSSNEAIIGTTEGFAHQQGTRYESFHLAKDLSYNALNAKQPQLWLGTRGARLGQVTWLFGTAGGVVAYRSGMWFYPARLNWMLPEDYRFKSNYGVRTVHAVESDSAGHIYVGNDRGLLIYDIDGGDPDAFLVAEDGADTAFRATEQMKLNREANVVLSSIAPSSVLGAKVQQIISTRREIENLQNHIGASSQFGDHENAALALSGNATTSASIESSRVQLELKRKEETKLLLEIENENRSLFQMLELKPLDLEAMRSKIDTNQIVVQFLPTKQSLYIHIVNSTISETLEVKNVPSADLEAHALAAWQELSGTRVSANLLSDSARAPDIQPPNSRLAGNLHWLYSKLLGPIEDKLEGKQEVYIVPVGTLNYVPFAALIRSSQPKIEYAIERYNLGYLPSLYLLDLIHEHTSSTSPDALVMANPDNTLRGAEQEATVVRGILGGKLNAFIGNDASRETLVRYSPSVHVVHLATHGSLDAEHPERSYLLLADNYRFNVIDAMQLQLHNVDLVTLSACETGIGVDGLEYATLARAFIQAGAPTVMATLWKAEDQATRTLMESFYSHLRINQDRFAALSLAQRDMIAKNRGESAIKSWAGFIVFGKP
jgi:YD repeat-containing protein